MTWELFADIGRPYRCAATRAGDCHDEVGIDAKDGRAAPTSPAQRVERVVETLFTAIGDALAWGVRIEIRGFGAFSLKDREARAGRNPRTGAAVEVPRKVIPFFKTGKHLHASLNEER